MPRDTKISDKEIARHKYIYILDKFIKANKFVSKSAMSKKGKLLALHNAISSLGNISIANTKNITFNYEDLNIMSSIYVDLLLAYVSMDEEDISFFDSLSNNYMNALLANMSFARRLYRAKNTSYYDYRNADTYFCINLEYATSVSKDILGAIESYAYLYIIQLLAPSLDISILWYTQSMNSPDGHLSEIPVSSKYVSGYSQIANLDFNFQTNIDAILLYNIPQSCFKWDNKITYSNFVISSYTYNKDCKYSFMEKKFLKLKTKVNYVE